MCSSHAAQHQVLHTHNFGTDSLLWFYFSGGLNLQVPTRLYLQLQLLLLLLLLYVAELGVRSSITFSRA
jgi:hypothetical protein